MPQRPLKHLKPLIRLLLILLWIPGCDSQDARLLEISRDSLDRQAEQNRQIAQQSQHLAEANRSLIEADAKTRANLFQQQQQIQSERDRLNQKADQLANDRQSFLKAQVRDPIVAQALLSAGALLAAVVPLLIGYRLFRHLERDHAETQVADALLCELLQPDSLLLAPPPPIAIEVSPRPLLTTEVAPESTAPTLIVVESRHDVEFLQRISQILHLDDPQLPDLVALEATGRLRFLPVGGDDLRNWPDRLDGLGYCEFHLYDRELPPVTAERKVIVERINSRPGCVARLTSKRALENYLHPAVVRQVLSLEIDINDTCDVAEQVARQLLTDDEAWLDLTHRQKHRLRSKARQRLNTDVVSGMTAVLLDERDPQGEVRGWLRQIAELS